MSMLFPKEFERPWPFEIHTDEHAIPIAWRLVKKGAPVIHVDGATIRLAKVTGYFELAKDGEKSFKKVKRKRDSGEIYEERRVHVICYWHGRALKTGWLSLELPEGSQWPKIRYDYEKEVIIDIGRVEDHTSFYRGSPGHVGNVFNRFLEEGTELHDYSAAVKSNIPNKAVAEEINPSTEIRPYQEYNAAYNSRLQPHQLSRHEMSLLVRDILVAESPIHEDEIGRRVAKCFGLNRAGSRIQNAVKSALTLANLVNKDGFWSESNSTPVAIRDRSKVESRFLLSAEYLPPEEIEEALIVLVRQNIQIHQDELIQRTSRMFGFLRCGPDLSAAIGRVLNGCARLTTDASSSIVELSHR